MAVPHGAALPALADTLLVGLVVGVVIFVVVILVTVFLLVILQAVLPRADTAAEEVHRRELELAGEAGVPAPASAEGPAEAGHSDAALS